MDKQDQEKFWFERKIRGLEMRLKTLTQALIAATPLDWPEDFYHENGNYVCHCCYCKEQFRGYKRRVVCKKCDLLRERGNG